MDSVCQRIFVVTGERVLRADARRNRARVLEVAESVFAAQGVEVPVEEVARAAGVGVGTVYRHFPTKKDLVEAIVAERMRRLVDRARTLAAHTDSPEALFQVVDWIVAEATVKKHLQATDTAPGADKPAALEALAADLRAVLSQLLAADQAGGTVRADIELPDLLMALYGLSAAAEHYGWDTARRHRAITTVFEGLRPRERSQNSGQPGSSACIER
ncbi:TetR/AcrR family transcriptional regulator [Nocardia sp. CA-136227]|uniref:TetR/AcrR family transcriptional regulator n=1 Tax=Nocardia sp. CA-136227 TaxID=3239979 RepID=UPI003D972041